MNKIPPYSLIDMDAHPPLVPISINHLGMMDTALFFSRLFLAGIDGVCGTLTPPPDFFQTHEPAQAVSLLNESAWTLSHSHKNYFPVLCIHPDCPDFSIAQLKKYAAYGIRMLEVNAAWLEHPDLSPILDCAQSLGMTAVLQGETPSQAQNLAHHFPALHLLVGGLRSKGYMPAIAHALMNECPRVSINLSGVIWGLNYGLHEWTERLGANRLFFGTGYPNCNPAAKIAALRWELRDHSPAVQRSILSENARRLMGTEGSTAWK